VYDLAHTLAHAERNIYDRYRVTVIGFVSIKMQLSNSQEIEMRKIACCLRGQIDKSTLHRSRAKYASWLARRFVVTGTTSPPRHGQISHAIQPGMN